MPPESTGEVAGAPVRPVVRMAGSTSAYRVRVLRDSAREP